jgi:hypothetical protein
LHSRSGNREPWSNVGIAFNNLVCLLSTGERW